MYAFQIYFNVTKRLLQSSSHILGSFRLMNTMHQFKLNTVVKYPKRETLKPVYTKQSLLEQMNLNSESFSTRAAERKSYYSILGLKKDATLRDIKKAYYVLARKHHPDASSVFTSPESGKPFQEIAEAYRILSDDNKRLEYDLYGVVKHDKKKITEAARRDYGEQSLRKVFDEVGFKRGIDIDPPHSIKVPGETTVRLTFLQSIRGTTKELNVKVIQRCPECTGIVKSSMKKNSETNRTCNGTGIQSTTNTHRAPCKAYPGSHYLAQHTCAECGGRGIVLVNKLIDVSIPPGVNSGDVIKVPHPGKNQQIAIRVQVAKSDQFDRVDNDLFSNLSISLSQAVLGGVAKVKGIFDDHEIFLEPGTESGTRIRLVGKGVRTNSGVGDHILTVRVKIPKTLTTKQRALMTAFAEIEADQPDQKARLRRSKIKDELATLHRLNRPQSPASRTAQKAPNPEPFERSQIKMLSCKV